MRLKNLAKHAITLSLAAGLAACSHAQPAPEAQIAEPKPAAVAAEKPKAAPTPDASAQGQAELDKAMEELRNVSVFFEFDSSTLTGEAKDKLTAVGNVLAKYPQLKVRVEGYCDERGSEQYNLALGQRRADAAKRYLVSLGAHDRQLTAISFGGQKPKAIGHDAATWRQHSRGDLAARTAQYRPR